MATIEDVAQAAGVSTATVSYVINDSRRVSEALRARVLQAMEETNYRPNIVARSLRLGQTKTIGLIIPDSSNAFFAEVGRGLQDRSHALGFSVILCNTDGDATRESAFIDLLTKKQVDGLVFVASGDNAQSIRAVSRQGTPFVVVDRHLSGLEADEVTADNMRGATMATEYLLKLGHRRIACITGPSDVTPSADRVKGFRQAMKVAGLEPDEVLIIKGDFQFRSGGLAMQTLLALPSRPTAVFACNDLMAVGAISTACAAGLRVPQDVSIIGFDDIGLAAVANPPLTTVAQPKNAIGTLAADLLVERIRNPQAPCRQLLLPTELVIRQSCASPSQP
jgi:LacI family transcriptional regulator